MSEGLYHHNTISSSIMEGVAHKNVMEEPKFVKICVNISTGRAAADSKIANELHDILYLCFGQKPAATYLKKSISNFKARKGAIVGYKLTLRRKNMCEFLKRLIYIVLPRERDFIGFSVKQFDGNGNFSFSIKEHISFLEINYDKVVNIYGMDITIVTTAKNSSQLRALLLTKNFPIID
ncbi:50S ribosomal protein L5 [Wolbachia endosymbiont of Pentidionis agamae]|uniref:50S ribosomal protein L5 n=1 Tax=Wolbachia endosymbiont of Pentidionis agamae TaxID=3110435 RepID=UPI002FD040D9